MGMGALGEGLLSGGLCHKIERMGVDGKGNQKKLNGRGRVNPGGEHVREVEGPGPPEKGKKGKKGKKGNWEKLNGWGWVNPGGEHVREVEGPGPLEKEKKETKVAVG